MTEPLTAAELAAIQARAEKATPGPWDNEACEYIYARVPKGRPNGEMIAQFSTYSHHLDRLVNIANARFAATARTDVPRLLAEIERFRATPSLDGTLAEVVAWATGNFPEATAHSTLVHLGREAEELIDSITWCSAEADRDQSEIVGELIDILLLTAHLFARFLHVDLRAEVERKLAINKARTWGEADSQGVRSHIRGDDVSTD